MSTKACRDLLLCDVPRLEARLPARRGVHPLLHLSKPGGLDLLIACVGVLVEARDQLPYEISPLLPSEPQSRGAEGGLRRYAAKIIGNLKRIHLVRTARGYCRTEKPTKANLLRL